jgi:hypothetical protein
MHKIRACASCRKKKEMKIKSLLKKTIKYGEEKAEDLMLIGLKKFFREQHGPDSYIGVLGVGRIKEGYYLKGPWSTFIPLNRENPGAHARHFIKHALTTTLPPLPPDKGKPHKIVLVTLPSFITHTPISEQRKFLKDWSVMIESCNLPWCELTVWR